jgi:hypothetical protein
LLTALRLGSIVVFTTTLALAARSGLLLLLLLDARTTCDDVR